MTSESKDKNDYPLWLKIALRCPLRWKHWLRGKLHMAEYWSTKLVIDDDHLLCLIENTSSPDFDAYDKRLNEWRQAWGKHDSHIESYAVTGRFLRFKRGCKIPNEKVQAPN